MLQTIRENTTGIIAKVIVGLIVITFALWGVESLVSLTNREPAPIEVNGEKVSNQELQQGIELQRRQILAQMGENADPAAIDEKQLRQMVIDGLVQRTLLLQSAQEMGFHLSEEMIDQLIVNTPQFQIDGKFDRAQFESVLRGAGLTPLLYRDLVRKEKLIDQERSGYLLSAFATNDELERLIALDRQTRELSWVTLPADPTAVSVDESEIAASYEQQKANFVTEEQVRVDYVELDREDFARPDEVSAAEIQSAYQQLVDGFKSQEERSARHILIDINAERDDAAALAKANALRQEILDGADFAAVAKRESADLGSAAEGGELGYNGRGVFVEPFEKALFSLAEGAVSEPVRTEFGYHLIKVDGVRQTEVPTLAEAETDLRDQVAQGKAEQQYVAALERLADLSFSSTDLQSAADELGLQIRTSELFSRKGGADALSLSPRVVEAAFSDQILKDQLNSDPLELDAGRTVVIHLHEHVEPRQLSLDEVRPQIEQQVRSDKARSVAAQQAEQWLAGLQQGKALADLAPQLQWTEPRAVDRAAQDVPATVLRQVFSMPRPRDQQPEYALVAQADGSQTIVALHAVQAGSTELSDEERRSLAAMLSNQRGQLEYQMHLDTLKKAAEIQLN